MRENGVGDGDMRERKGRERERKLKNVEEMEGGMKREKDGEDEKRENGVEC